MVVTLAEIGKEYTNLGLNKNAKEFYHQALNLAAEKKLIIQEYRICFVLGIQYDLAGSYVKAHELYFRGLALAEKVGDKVSQSNFLNNIGLTFNSQKLYPKAIEYYNKALKIAKDLKDKYAELSPLGNLGVIYLDNKDYDKAINYFEKSISITKEIYDSLSLSISYSYMGLVHLRKGDFKKSEFYLSEALKIAEQIGDEYQIADVYNMYGEYYIAVKNYSNAIKYLENSLSISSRIGYTQARSESEQFLSDAYLASGNPAKALLHFKAYIAVRDSLSNIEIVRQQSAAELKYEELRQLDKDKADKEIKEITNRSKYTNLILISLVLVVIVFVVLVFMWNSRKNEIHKRKLLEAENEIEKERHNALIVKTKTIEEESERLHQLNSELVKKTEQLKYNNAEKDKMFSVLAHDLKSPFMGILGITQILVEDFDALSKEEVFMFLNQLKPAVFSVYGLLDNLLQWSRMQLNRITFERTDFNLHPVIYDIVNTLNENIIAKNINVEINIPDDFVLNADINMIRSISSNMISNAVKFTNIGGTISINSYKDVKSSYIDYIDNGVGISEEDLSKLFDISQNFTTTGTNGEAGTGLGLLLCKEMAKKHGGDISVASKLGRGTKFTVSIPF